MYCNKIAEMLQKGQRKYKMDTTPINPFFCKLFLRYVFLNWKAFVKVMNIEIKEIKIKDPHKSID